MLCVPDERTKKKLMKLKNCWEVMRCGREPGGEKIDEYGICPAAVSGDYDGINRGKFRGRFCWSVCGTLCNGKPQGEFAQKLGDCLDCEFLKEVNEQEGREFILTIYDAKRRNKEND